MTSTVGTIVALAVIVYFSVEGFAGNVALNVILLMAGIASLALVAFVNLRRRLRSRAVQP